MTSRKPTVPQDILQNARNLREAVNACLRLQEVRSMVDKMAASAGYRRYEAANTRQAQAMAAMALDLYFTSGSLAAVQKTLKVDALQAAEFAELGDDFRRSRQFSLMMDAMVDALAERFGPARTAEIGRKVSDSLIDAIMREVGRLDSSEPIDAIRGSEVVVGYVPGMPEGSGMDAAMTRFWGPEGSSALTIKPDGAFTHFLALANVSSEDWLDAVETLHGFRPDMLPDEDAEPWETERFKAWSSYSFEADASRPPLVNPEDLAHAVDGCPLGFAPMIAFNADAGHLCTRDWNLPISVKGGILGLHDFINGCGDPIRFEGKLTIMASPGQMILAEGRPNDFKAVHGFADNSFASIVSDEEPQLISAPAM